MTAAIPPTARIVTVCSEVGRGHPSYLDSLLAALKAQPEFRPGLLSEHTVFSLGSPVNRQTWRAARIAYELAGSGSRAADFYNRIRSGSSPSRLALALLGSNLRRRLAGRGGICVVDHPLLARILSDACRVVYLHAEIAAPRSAVVPRAWRTLVPLEETAAAFAAAGAWPDTLAVTGLVVEPELERTATTDFAARIERIRSDAPLAVGLFTSGAYPRPHLDLLAEAARSLEARGWRAVVFAGSRADRARELAAPGRTVCAGPGRADATRRECALSASLDVMVAAAHERTGRAVALGLPLFCLLPHIGPFAPLNYRFAHERGVCEPLATPADARSLGPRIAELRTSGRLEAMARSGRRPELLGGAEKAARLVLEWSETR